MNHSTIKEIFNGVSGRRESMAFTKTNKGALTEISNAYDTLRKRFNSKQIKAMDKFLEIYDDYYCDEIDFYFAEGFKLGLRLTVECLQDNR